MAQDATVEALVELLGRERVIAVTLFGSRADGTAAPDSDFDHFVLWSGPPRRGRFILEGREIEWIADAPDTVLSRLKEESGTVFRMVSNMWRNPVLLYDPRGLAADLVAKARTLAEVRPAVPDVHVLIDEYLTIEALSEDALHDFDRGDLLGFYLLADEFAQRGIRLRYATSRRVLPRPQALGEDIAHAFPLVASALLRFRSATTKEARQAFEKLVLEIISDASLKGLLLEPIR